MFTVQFKGKKLKLDTIQPTQQQESEAMKAYYRVYNDRLKQGAPLRMQIMDTLRTRGLWTDEKQAKVEELQNEVTEKEFVLESGGIKLSEAKTVALELLDVRNDLADLLTSHNELDNVTVEAQADNAKFNYLVFLCTLDNKTKKPYFKTIEDYEKPVNAIIAAEASQELFNVMYNESTDFVAKLPEHAFLKEYKFVNDVGRLIDKNGKLVNRAGDHIDEEGYLLDNKSERISSTGKKLDGKGDFIVEHKPFLDEKGNVI